MVGILLFIKLDFLYNAGNLLSVHGSGNFNTSLNLKKTCRLYRLVSPCLRHFYIEFYLSLILLHCILFEAVDIILLFILQAEGSEVSAELEFLNQQNLILNMENKTLKQRLESLAQEHLIKHCKLMHLNLIKI